MPKTKIEWTHLPGYVGQSWNPLRAENIFTGRKGWVCSRFSPGCDHCYAATQNVRLGTGLDYTKANLASVRVFLNKLDAPEKAKEPTCWFVNSMTDLFHPLYAFEQIRTIFEVMLAHPRHVYQVLTKVPERAADFMAANPDIQRLCRDQLNIWLGTTVESNDYARRIASVSKITQHPWVSYEPALGEFDLLDWPQLGWVVVGGESGPQARRLDLAWVRRLLGQRQETGQKVFVKQLGTVMARELGLKDRKGGDWTEWPEDLRVREWPFGYGTLAQVFKPAEENIDELARCGRCGGRWEDCGGNCGVVYE